MTSSAKLIREQILRIAHASGHGHIPTCFSVVELILAIYQVMRHDPADPGWENRDIFILSKGHAALAHYCILSYWGYFPIEEVFSFGRHLTKFGCHADRYKVPGIEASTGSLGHGIGLAVGMALALKLHGSRRRVFTIVGDGEANEGSVWEAIMVAVRLGLSNLTVIYDDNRSQNRCLPILNPQDRFTAFGCRTIEVPGHEVEKLVEAMQSPADQVTVLVAHTIKGNGCPTLVRDVFAWHRRSPSGDELTLLLKELDERTV